MVRIRKPMGPEGADGSKAVLDGYARLAAAVLIQAALDTQSKDLPTRIESILWLAGPEAQAIGEICGIDDPWKHWALGNFRLPDDAMRGRKEKFGWRIETRKFSRTIGYR
jgi:hypothetical protein